MRYALVAACLVAGLVPASAHAREVTKTAHSGDVTATLSYRVVKDVYSRVHLRIDRAGAAALDVPLKEVSCSERCTATWVPGPFSIPDPPVVRDLDGDGEPEVVLDLFTGGAHCCIVTAFYHWNGARYARRVEYFGDYGYAPRDLDGDGIPELSARDERFAYAFGPFVYSAAPLVIWQWRPDGLHDVTRRYPARLRADAQLIFGYYVRSRKRHDHSAIRGELPAWSADECRLGRCDYALARIDAALKAGELGGPSGPGEPTGRRYVAALRAFLHKTGYLR